ncbi:MAG: hypothetical protein IIB54_12620, partial [Planctomycetes bacterium]|nr:hypothetical protein [Planctomycetota bacterium]
MSLHIVLLALVAFMLVPAQFAAAQSGDSPLKFGISVSEAEEGAGGLDGRMFLLISKNNDKEPRFQIGNGPDAQLIFGIDVNGLKPGEDAIFDASVFGYPLASLADLPPGDYYIQGLLHKYETFHRADGHTVKLPMDRGEGQHWNRAPGNLYSVPRKIHIDPSEDRTIRIRLTETIPPIEPPVDTPYIKHIKIQSK